MNSFPFKYLLVLSIAGIATWVVWAEFAYPLTGIDDSNIFFVYARNMATGHGFVYNVGGERIEGFTSMLWTLLCTLVFALSTKPELPLLLVNVIILALGATAGLHFVESAFFQEEHGRYKRSLRSLIFVLFLFSSPAYILWNTIVLMENAIWGTLLLLATIFVVQPNISSRTINLVFIPLSVLLLITRPESVLWVAVFTAILLVRRTMANGKIQALREMVPLFSATIAVIIILTVFRIWYFGYPLPNTFYAKVSPSLFYNLFQGTKYIVKYFVSNPLISICILAAVMAGIHTIIMLIERRSAGENGLQFLPIIAGIGLFMPVINGGDHFRSFRFYQSIYPILLLCLLYFVKTVLPHYIKAHVNPNVLRPSQLVFIASLVLLLASGFVLYQARDWMSLKETSRMSLEFDFAKDGREKGQFIRDLFTVLPQLPSIGVIRSGGIKYTYPGRVIDLMGLNNLLMAHNGGSRVGEKNHAAFEKTTFYQLQPDIVSEEIVSSSEWQYSATELKKSWDNTVPLKGLYNDSAFLELYEYAKIDRKEKETDQVLVGWFKKDFLSDLAATGDFVIERYEYPATE